MPVAKQGLPFSIDEAITADVDERPENRSPRERNTEEVHRREEQRRSDGRVSLSLANAFRNAIVPALGRRCWPPRSGTLLAHVWTSFFNLPTLTNAQRTARPASATPKRYAVVRSNAAVAAREWATEARGDDMAVES